MENPSGNVGLEILGLFYFQLLGQSTGALTLVQMLIGDN